MKKYYINGEEREVEKAYVCDFPVYAQLITRDNIRLERRVYVFKGEEHDEAVKNAGKMFVKINKSMFSIGDLERSGYEAHVYF